MAEAGAPPKVSWTRRRVLSAVSAWTSPLRLDDYLELINPMWSTRELRGKIASIEHETPDAVTVTIKPAFAWEGHEPGQYLRIGFEIDGIHHWRAYSLTSDPTRADGAITITPKLVPEGRVSPYLVHEAGPGTIVKLGGVEGTFTLPDPLPAGLLFISAGSGVTPVMSMVGALDRRGELHDAVHLHSARHADDVIFGSLLRDVAQRNAGYRLHEHHTDERDRMTPADLHELCPDWRERETFLSGPPEMLEAMEEHFEEQGATERLHLEHFQPATMTGEGERGDGGSIKLRRSGCTASSDGTVAILAAGEDAGAVLPYGCRMGICHTCVGMLSLGRVRDLRTGEVFAAEGQMIRTCINAPEGDVEIDL